MKNSDLKNQRFWDGMASSYDKQSKKLMGILFNNCIDLLRDSIEEGANVIDMGCGTGIISYAISDKSSKVIGVDMSEAMLSLAKAKNKHYDDKHVTFKQADIHFTGLKNHFADNTLLCNIIHLSQTPENLLLEAKRVTKPNGMIITATACFGSVRSLRGFLRTIGILAARFLNIIPYIKIYTFKSLRRELEKSGMVIIAEKKIQYLGIRGLFAILKT